MGKWINNQWFRYIESGSSAEMMENVAVVQVWIWKWICDYYGDGMEIVEQWKWKWQYRGENAVGSDDVGLYM